jgi:hypothetical protein
MSAIVLDQPTALPQKHESTLIAQLALRGHATHKLERGGYLVVWQGCSRHCGDLESLEAFARQVGAVR